MFAFGLRYLCGFASAAHPKSREAPEWPPHPDRIFMALAAAYFEADGGVQGRAALEWLESLPTPMLQLALAFEPHAPVPVFVPVNGDRRNMESLIKVMPSERKRDRRFFPAALLENDTAFLIWNADLPAEHRTALEGLCAKVGYVGDTSSLVQMWVEDNPPEPTLVPAQPTHFAERLRVPYPGRLADLEADYQRDMDAGEYRPRVFQWGYYRAPEKPRPSIPASKFDLLVFRRESNDALDIRDTLMLTDALRGAVMKAGVQPPSEWVSGHTSDGRRSERDHLAFVALPNVGNEHADGTLKGVALAVPHDTLPAEMDSLMNSLFPWDDASGNYRPVTLTMGRAGVWRISPEDQPRPKMMALQKGVWLGPARMWATVTPIVLDRYPKGEGDAEETIARACERIGLPRPIEVVLMPGSLFVGALPAKHFPPLPVKFGKTKVLHTHALLIFAEEVQGPALLGAGRYRGYGLCRPYRSGGEA